MGLYDSIQEFVRRAHGHLPPINIVIPNAGLVKMTLFKNLATGHEETFRVNYLSTMLLTVVILPIIKAKRPNNTEPARLTIVSAALTLAASFPNKDANPLLPSLMSWHIHPYAAFLYTPEGEIVRNRLWDETVAELQSAGVRGILQSMKYYVLGSLDIDRLSGNRRKIEILMLGSPGRNLDAIFVISILLLIHVPT